MPRADPPPMRIDPEIIANGEDPKAAETDRQKARDLMDAQAAQEATDATTR